MLDDDELGRRREELMVGRRALPRIGSVLRVGGDEVVPYVVLDPAGDEVTAIGSYLRDRILGDVSPLTCRSYGQDLLRWFRLLWCLEVPWDRATEVNTATLVGWLRTAENPQRRRIRPGAPAAGAVNRRTGKPEPQPGYAPATIGHALTVIFGFYDFHLHFGRGPLVNPVPDSKARRAALAH